MSENNNQITIFGETNFRNRYRKFGIKLDDRRRHMYLIGKTGMGKSTILENMIIEDIRAGKGVAVVDPHGDLAEKVIQFIPSSRINDTIYFNPSDLDYPIAFNVVEHVEPHMRHIVASGLIGVFQKLWADSWGPRLEYILRNTILAVLDYPGATLMAVIRMLSDKVFRKKVIEKIQDPVVKAFWVKEFASYADKFAVEAVSPIQNKVGQFLSTALIRNVIGQVKSSIDMRDIMDNKKVLIMNLSKGRIGEDNSALLGAMMITKIQLAAMSRVDMPETEREDFYLYVDEFQNFATDSFANILSEARKYRLNLIMAHQYIEQLSEKVKPAVFGNVGTIITFRVGATDAEELVKEFTPTFTEEDLVNIPKYEIYCRLMIDGVMSDPFSARGLAPLTKEEETGNVEKVIRVSRERYARKREEVEEKILKWHMGDDDEKPAPAAGAKFENGPRPKFADTGNKKPYDSPAKEWTPNRDSEKPKEPSGFKKTKDQIYTNQVLCSRCETMTNVSFVPDGIRPVFCRDCLTLIKQEKNQEVENRKKAKQEEMKKLENAAKKDFERPKESKRPGGPDQENDLEISKGEIVTLREEKDEENVLTLGDLTNKKPVVFSGARPGAGPSVNFIHSNKNRDIPDRVMRDSMPDKNIRSDDVPPPKKLNNMSADPGSMGEKSLEEGEEINFS
jgi:CxxC-x17-CxxC domain-containing protein